MSYVKRWREGARYGVKVRFRPLASNREFPNWRAEWLSPARWQTLRWCLLPWRLPWEADMPLCEGCFATEYAYTSVGWLWLDIELEEYIPAPYNACVCPGSHVVPSAPCDTM